MYLDHLSQAIRAKRFHASSSYRIMLCGSDNLFYSRTGRSRLFVVCILFDWKAYFLLRDPTLRDVIESCAAYGITAAVLPSV